MNTISRDLKKVYELNNDAISPEVSVVCICYNHEKYISRCLDSILSQLVTFGVEIIIHDDCSTDNSREIIDGYKQKYPNIIKCIYEDKNVYSIDHAVIWDNCLPFINGKYIAICETDDFWNDNLKLVSQKEAMDKVKDVSLALHRVTRKNCLTGEEDKIPDKMMRSGVYDSEFVFKELSKAYSFQTSSYFFRKDKFSFFIKHSHMLSKVVSFDDLSILYLLAQNSKVIYLNKEMSIYSYNISGSWTRENKEFNLEKQEKYYKSLILYYGLINKITCGKYKKHLYRNIYVNCCRLCILKKEGYRIIRSRQLSRVYKQMSLKEYIKMFIRYKIPVLYKLFKRK